MSDEEALAQAEEFLAEAEGWLEERTGDPERLAMQFECARAMRERLERVVGHRLKCVECGETSTRTARGWRTFLTIDDQVATYCPECAEAEFDG